MAVEGPYGSCRRTFCPSHVCAGPLSPGVVLIVKSYGTNILAYVNCIRTKFSTISLWLLDCWKVVPDLKSDPRGPLTGPPFAPQA